jgi:hypothetical protein
MTKPTVEELLEWIATAKYHYPHSPSVEVVCNALRERLVGEQHSHRCMRCNTKFYCLQPRTCAAKENVMPRVVANGPDGISFFEHVCKPPSPEPSDGKE